MLIIEEAYSIHCMDEFNFEIRQKMNAISLTRLHFLGGNQSANLYSILCVLNWDRMIFTKNDTLQI